MKAVVVGAALLMVVNTGSIMDTAPIQPAEKPDTFTQRLHHMLGSHEGNSGSMYCDSCEPPVVTVGVGHALFTSQAAKALPFLDAKTGSPASSAQIEAEYSRTKALRVYPGSRPYLILPVSEVSKLEDQDVEKAVGILRKELGDFDTLPEDARLALIDIAFNCGSLMDFPHLRAAVKARDWKAAASHAHRAGVSATRNQDVQALLRGLA